MLAHCGRRWYRSGRLAALALLGVHWAQCPLVVPEVVLELDLLLFVDQFLADQQEPVKGPVVLEGLIVLVELYMEGSVGVGVLRWVAICDKLIQQVLECLVHVLLLGGSASPPGKPRTSRTACPCPLGLPLSEMDCQMERVSMKRSLGSNA